MPNHPAMTWSVCELCKKVYEVAKKELRRGRKFCSMECAVIGKKRRGNRNQWGANNPNWKGGRTSHTKGYSLVRSNHPRNHNGYVLEHIVVAERKIGRRLKGDEVVHHKNEIVTDNRKENIEVMSRGEHTRYHNKRRARIAKEARQHQHRG